MILKSLEDLEKYKDSISNFNYSVGIKEINEVSDVGGESTNKSNNKLFYWNFEPYYIEELVRCFENLRSNSVNTRKIHEFEIDIRLVAKEMMNENTCPIEAILYSSKVVNNLIIENNNIVDLLGKIICDIYNKNKNEYKETIEFILKEWSWSNQIIILINACGKIRDIDLLQIVNDYHTRGISRLESLKAFMNVPSEICNEYSLKLISLTQESDSIEVQMAKYFINNYYKCYGLKGIKRAEDYLAKEELNKQVTKIISRVIPNVSEVESVTLNTMIKKAKNWNVEKDFDNCFKTWMSENTTRKNALLAARYSNSPKVENMVIDTLESYKCNSVEIGTALITLAQWGSRKGLSEEIINLIEENKEDLSKRVYCNAAMCSIGREGETLELIKDFLEEEYYDSKQIFSIIRDCAYKSNQLLKKGIEKVYCEYLYSSDEEKQIKAINAAYELCDKPKFNFKDIVIPQVKQLLGLKDRRNMYLSENIYFSILNLVERLLNDTNKDEFIDILFFIIDNDKCSSKLKTKSTTMLKRLRVDPPK